MDDQLMITGMDGFEFECFRSTPAGQVSGGIVVLHEGFGLNHHIRSICRRLAAAGFIALAPNLFERMRVDADFPYTPEGLEIAKSFATRLDWPTAIEDAGATAALLTSRGPVGTLGFCMGGTLAWLLACRRNDLAATVSYYGGHIIQNLRKAPACPAQMHFGRFDPFIPMDDVEEIGRERPEVDLNVYEAHHGFCCDERKDFHAESAAIAWARTIEFFRWHLAR